MPDVDESSQLFGQLQADMASSQRQRELLFELLAKVKDAISDLKLDVGLMGQKLDGHINEFRTHSDEEMLRFKHLDKWRTEDVEPVLTEVKAVRNKAIGVVAVLSLMGTGAWQGIGKLFETLSGK